MRTRYTRSLYIATVTSKGQITIPVAIVRGLGLQRGDKLEVTIPDDAPDSIAFQPLRSTRQQRPKKEAARS